MKVPTLVLLASALAAPPLAAGVVSGNVRSASGTGLSGMTVQAWTADGVFASQVASGPAGAWALSLASGTYRLLAFDANGAFATDFYPGAGSFGTSTKVAVADCTTLPGVDFALAQAGYLAGTIRDASGSLLAGLTVAAYNADGTLRGTATTGSTGQYRLGAPGGSYRLAVYDDARRYTTQFWHGVTDFEESSAVSVSGGQTASGLDFTLARAGVLTGSVRDLRGGAPLGGIALQVLSPSGAKLASAVTHADGGWGAAVPPGDVKVVASDPSLAYRAGVFAGASSLATGTVLSAQAGQTIAGVDFALASIDSASPTELFVVAAANAPGANGTYFRADLWVLNVSTATAHLGLTYLPGGLVDNTGAVPVAREVAPGAELVVPDAVNTLFGVTGAGAIRITSDVPVLATTRTATPAPGAGSFGLGVPAVSVARAVTSGRIPGVRVNATYRTNAGFVNPGAAPVTVALTLSDAAGAVLATGSVALPPYGQFQASTIATYLGLSSVEEGTLRATASAPFLAYATVIDNATGDATFLAAEPD